MILGEQLKPLQDAMSKNVMSMWSMLPVQGNPIRMCDILLLFSASYEKWLAHFEKMPLFTVGN
eukprot:7044444-Ditylum_brightwellii.AAC.1